MTPDIQFIAPNSEEMQNQIVSMQAQWDNVFRYSIFRLGTEFLLIFFMWRSAQNWQSFLITWIYIQSEMGFVKNMHSRWKHIKHVKSHLPK